MARQVPYVSSDLTGFYGGAATVPVLVGGRKPSDPSKTALAFSSTSNRPDGKKPKDKKPQQQQQNNNGSGSGGTENADTPADTGQTAAKKKAAQRAANAAARANKYNPLVTRYKSPAELRAEAAELAALSVASEESLRTQQGLQETGLTGLSTALGNRLAGLNTEYQATLGGLGSAYGQTAANTAAATNEQLIASGAPASVAPVGANPMLANTTALLGAVPSQYAATAAATGAQLVGSSRAALQKSLTDRANTVSANTAKYLQQLRDTEYNKAIAKVTAEQNAARLGVDAEYKAGQLGVAQTNAQTAIGQLNRQILKDQKAGKTAGSTIKTVKRGILANPNTWTEPIYSSTDYEWTFALGEGKTATGIGPNRNAAITNARNSGAMTAADLELNKNNSAWGMQGDPVKIVPKYEDVYAQLMSILVNAGDTPKKASAWIATFMPGVARLPRS